MHIVIGVVIPMFLLIIFGIIYRRFFGFEKNLSGPLISYALGVGLPALILVSLEQSKIGEVFDILIFMLIYLLVVAIIFALAFIYSRYIKREDFLEAIFFGAASSYSNTCMIGMPVLILQLGKIGGMYGLLGIIALIFGLQFVSCVYDYCNDKSSVSVYKRVLLAIWGGVKQKYFIAFILGIIILLTGFKFPIWIDKTLIWFSNTYAPVALFAVGVDLEFSIIMKHWRKLVEAGVFKLAIMPVLGWFFGWVFNLGLDGSVALFVTSGVATAKCEYALAKSKGFYEEETAAIVAGTTLILIISLSVILYLVDVMHPNLISV